VTHADQVKRLVEAAAHRYGAHRCDDQQRRVDAAFAARAPQDRRL
jgi:hypothetical protein